MAWRGEIGFILELEFPHSVMLRVVVAIVGHMKLPEAAGTLDKALALLI